MKRKAFTLIELLVVIAIIALLLSIIMPSLRKAKEAAQRIVCLNNYKSVGTANGIYANEHKGWFVAIYYQKPDTSYVQWMANKDYRSYLDMDNMKDSAVDSDFNLPDKLLCPSDRVSRDIANAGAGGVLTSIGANLTEWTRNGWLTGPYAGYKAAAVKGPGTKLAFSDTVDWWITWGGADYVIGWDKLGQVSLQQYKDATPPVHGPVLYRHNEGANIGFYDGHADYMKKTDMYIDDDYRATPRRPGMWVVDYNAYNK
ncbi:MAG: prepilin-type N-terminal cleavage/methylation domain-containing protein [Planctomycetaceae bacterium]|nr:prepilin-type N-terminal cleavage/methylation domain-containing protein [Planctomycetaceae bacterium]